MSRKKLPSTLAHEILYRSEYVCVICQSPGGQIHHIDGNNSNNVEENLVFLCLRHHGEAHSKSTLTRNLGPNELVHAKTQWQNTVEQRRLHTATASAQSGIGVTWGLINHSRVAQIARQIPASSRTSQLIEHCIERGIVDNSGIIIEPDNYVASDSFVYNSIYDRFKNGDDQRLHQLYSEIVDDISRAVSPIHIEEEHWSKDNIENLVSNGAFIFVQHRFYFKVQNVDQYNEHRKVHYKKNKVHIEFFIDSYNMFGTTSMTTSFVGGNHCAALLQVKSINEINPDGILLQCTPIALGVGFHTTSSKKCLIS